MIVMGKINRLDEHLANMIAAGEVVERPSGIVKELVENSIDAKSKKIEIQVSQGGIQSITIIDDGEGMDPQDACVAFERHATSKLKEVDDLWKIMTMGFRGEALPSIAAVSQVLLRTNNGTDATEVNISYGKMNHVKPCATPKGTVLEIKNLFLKTPARFKHLKSAQYEFSLIQDVVQKFALAYPEISFKLSHDGRMVFQTRGSGQLLEVLMQIYGRELAKTAIEIKNQDNDYQISGYAMQPQHHRATKYYTLLYINKRMIRNYHLQKAVFDAYAPYMPKDRYPIAVLNLEMDAQLVDVNVHPSKWEIRLSKEKQLEKLIYDTITKALSKGMQIPTLKQDAPKKEKVESIQLQLETKVNKEEQQIKQEVNESFIHIPKEQPKIDTTIKVEPKSEKVWNYPSGKKDLRVEEPKIQYPLPRKEHKQPISQSKPVLPVPKVESPVDVIELPKPKVEAPVEVITESKVEIKPNQSAMEAVELPQNEVMDQPKSENISQEMSVNSFPSLTVLGQFRRSYILAQGEKGLYIIDQHAAAERFHYEEIKRAIMAGVKDTQLMLMPLTLEKCEKFMPYLDEINAQVETLGIQFECFGDDTLIVRELPIWMKDVNEADFLRDILEFYHQDKEMNIEKLRKHAIATMACHSSIRFHRTLTMEEMQQVIKDLSTCEQPYHCPHGRTTIICIEDKDLLKHFDRI